jgi:hypothetical protein
MEAVFGNNGRDRRVASEPLGVSPVASEVRASLLGIPEACQVRRDYIRDGAAVSVDRVRAAHDLTLPIDDEPAVVDGDDQHLGIAGLTKCSPLPRVLCDVQAVPLHREAAGAPCAQRAPTGARGLERCPAQFLVGRDGVEAAVAEIENDGARNRGDVVKITRIGDHIFERVGDSRGGGQTIGRAARQHDRIGERFVVRKPQAVGVDCARRPATHVNRCHDGLREVQHRRTGRALLVFGDADHHAGKVKRQRGTVIGDMRCRLRGVLRMSKRGEG